ncbi:hypothetical protein [Dyella mobilis]|uniref:Sel1 repeat family protein n=1 Tax=Dyella mobilis TaxID=1849582 RepID=A0ABS2KLM5_9GAMM|nr:hypothetical protein [Dyella mobilis]MBM7131682.1 hypothetical protein [Dyella mobilis]GLQ96342.1 hypothetical protein GCM10007863_07600 [Dyella mobilis]
MSHLLWKSSIALLLALPWVAASQADTTSVPVPASSSSQNVPSDAELAAANCVIGEERFLPGDYYYCLGGMTYGERHYGDALRFFTTAASWASKPAQYVLGVMALNGDHQPKNRALALAWLALAAERPESRFKSAYEQVYKASTPAQRGAADELLAKMRPVYADATAAVRAQQRYTDGMKFLAAMKKGSNRYCMEGMSTIDHPNTDPSTCQSVQQVATVVDKKAAEVFEGWGGHVSVGPLQQVPSP